MSAIKTDIGLTHFVKILKGIKEGDILSAILFCIVIASIMPQSAVKYYPT